MIGKNPYLFLSQHLKSLWPNRIYKILDKYNTSISKKTILERAGKVVIAGLKQKSEAIKDTGNLKKSAGWIRIKSKVSVMAGFNYWKGDDTRIW